MKIEIKVPAMGESISEATIGTFIKATGSKVASDDEMIELETDKVNQVLYAPEAGVVTWNVKQGDVVKIGQVIGSVDTEGKQSAKAVVSPKPKEKAKNKEAVTKSEEVSAATTASELFQHPALPTLSKSTSSSPTGTRVTKEDFISEVSTSELSSEVPHITIPAPSIVEEKMPTSDRSETRQKMSRIRKVIANRLVDVMQQTAMLTTFNEVDMTNIMNLRETHKEAFAKQHQTRLGLMSFFVKASVSAMKLFPEVNAYIDGDDIVYRHYFDIGIAIGTERGLIVPVVRGCDNLSFAEIERSIENYAKKAREGGLSPNDLQGGGFTITNGGTYGSLLSTPIINPPQCAILGMHKIMKRPVVVNDAIVIRQMMYLALSYDHRIIDGKGAVSFLVHIKNCLEDPSRILIGL